VTPHCDHADHACNFEVVLPDGTLINTGYGALPGSPLGPLDPYGVGPSFDGIFAQSNYGVVTRATIWLYPAPERVDLAILSIHNSELLGSVINTLRPLRLQGSLRAGPNFGNDSFLMSRRISRPKQLYGLRGRALQDSLVSIARQRGLPAWRGMVPLYGTRSEVE